MNPLAVIHAECTDVHAVWLATNTAFCSRMVAKITVAACQENQHQSKFDSRCTGCRGLFDQSGPVEAPLPQFAFLDASDVSQLVTEKSGTWSASEDHVRAGLDEDELEELLAEYFPDEEAEHEERREPLYLDNPIDAKGQRIPVYVGRCVRCGSYMINTLERRDGIKDDDVYRCFTCGWRTSPGYEINRALFAAERVA